MKQKLKRGLRWCRAKKYRLVASVIIAVALVIGVVGGTYALILGGSAAPVNNASVNLSQGLIGYWPFTGNANDASGNGNNGTVSGASLTTDKSGYPNQAYSFDGSSNYIDYGSPGLLHPNYLTWSMWIRPTDFSNNPMFFSEGSGDYMRLFNSKLIVDIYVGSVHSLTCGTTLSNNTWYHVAATFDGSVMSVYLNGSLCTSANWSGTSGSYNSSLKLGAYTGPSSYYSGTIDDFRYYNRALSAAEIKALANPPTLNAASGEKGLVGWWKMDGNAKDASPYGNNGTVTAATLTTDRKNKTNGAYSFNGTNATIDIGTPSSLTFERTNSFSVGAWIKTTSSGGETILSKLLSNGTTYPGYEFGVGGGKLFGFLSSNYGSNNYILTASTTAVNDGKWHYVSMTYNGSSTAAGLTYYVDGVATGSTVTKDALSASILGSADVEIGTRNNQQFYFNGSMDDVRVYNRVLGAAEIASLYNSYDAQVNISSLQSGLVGSWLFNGNAKDGTPYGNNGTVTNATLTTDRKGIANSAYGFSGITQYITVPNNSALKPTTAITVSAWIKPTNFAYDGARVISSSENGGYTLATWTNSPVSGCTTNSVCFDADVTGGYLGTSFSTSLLTAGVWSHVTATYDGTTMRIYLNGVQQGTHAVSSSITENGTSPICIGSEPNTTACNNGPYFNGSIDDVRVWNRALSAAEVSALYQEYR